MNKPYKLIDHTADIGLSIEADSKEKIFEFAALGMFDQLADLSNVLEKENIKIELEAEDSLEELFLIWLQVLRYYHIEGLILKKFIIDELTNTKLKAQVYGEYYNPTKHTIFTEIKLVTYHQLEVKKINNKWQAKVIFDL